MKVFYDTEFHERGPGYPIDFISIGMARADSAEYYAVTDDLAVIQRAVAYPWLRENVVPSLPVKVEPFPTRGGGIWNYVTWDHDHPDWPNVKPRKTIAAEVGGFVLAKHSPQLWAWYAAYDHVVLCQLFGRMIDLPKGFPMFTNDLKQECDRLGGPPVPQQAEGEHNARCDARHNRVVDEFLRQYAVERGEDG